MNVEYKKKICSKCKQKKKVSEFYYHKTRKIYMSSCKECNNKDCVKYGKKKVKEQDITFLIRRRASSIKRDCKAGRAAGEYDDNLPNLLLNQFKIQEGKCYYTGEKLSFDNYGTNPNFATIDRLDPSKGYVKGNVVFCSSIANKVKQNLSFPELKSICLKFIEFIDKNS
jgi:hypothetical protein